MKLKVKTKPERRASSAPLNLTETVPYAVGRAAVRCACCTTWGPDYNKQGFLVCPACGYRSAARPTWPAAVGNWNETQKFRYNSKLHHVVTP